MNTQLPRIVVPPKELKDRLRKHDLDPSISAEPLQLFDNGHFNEAVRKAFEKYENEIRNISGIDTSGRDLMSKAFADTKYINTTEIKPENTKDFNDGYKLLAMGSMAAIRNIFSHGDEIPRSPEECFETLLFLNWLFRYIKRRSGDGTR